KEALQTLPHERTKVRSGQRRPMPGQNRSLPSMDLGKPCFQAVQDPFDAFTVLKGGAMVAFQPTHQLFLFFLADHGLVGRTLFPRGVYLACPSLPPFGLSTALVQLPGKTALAGDDCDGIALDPAQVLIHLLSVLSEYSTEIFLPLFVTVEIQNLGKPREEI